MLDKNGFLLEIGQDVNVQDSNNSYIGDVVDILEDRNTIIVKDADNKFFELESDNVMIRND